MAEGRKKNIVACRRTESAFAGYAPSGKILTPIPVFRWARGQRLEQNLLSLQLPLYEQIMEKAPTSLRTLIASGDVYIRAGQPLQDIPDVDVVCYGLWVDSIWQRITGCLFLRVAIPINWTLCFRNLRSRSWEN